ncbi:hypothetical protein HZC30_02950 [Candidatus Woesearchaeota archaeon]|nr:hypothetical protein [Candidatus Woesearchaeota archaeon]
MASKKRSTDSGSSKCIFSNSSNKKGQVTVFIIVGILMLFAFAAIMYFTQTRVTQEISEEVEPALAQVPAEFQPLRSYTENCIQQIGKRGLLILGQQGGYIYPDLAGKFSASDPTEADGIDLEPIKVPYWHYNIEKNKADKVVYSSLAPKLYAKDDGVMSIEAQLARFVKERLDNCLDNYTPFTQQGFEIDLSEQIEDKKVSVKVGENNVIFTLSMPLSAQKGDAKTEFTQFYAKIPLQLKHYYEIANLIAATEQNFSFLEKHGLELIAVYSKVDPQYFPPISEVTYEPVSAFSWSEVDLQQKYKDLLTSYIPMLRFLGSSNFYHATFPEGNILAQRVADNAVLTLTGADDLEVSFDYFGWLPYFKANSEDGVIKPESQHISAFGVLDFNYQRYETHYDASFPTLVTLKDKYAFDGAGYSFVFALEGNIRNNAPAIPNKTQEYYPKTISPLACGEEHQQTGLLKTVVVDSFSKEPIELVKIGFSIPEQIDCDMGLTNNEGVFEDNYPAVYGGMLSLIKQDYLTDFYPIDTYKLKNSTALIGYAVEGIQPAKVIELHRIKYINVTVKKKELKECVTPLSCEYTLGPSLALIPYKDIECELGKRRCFFNQEQGLFESGEKVYDLNVEGSKSKKHEFYFMDKAKPLAQEEEAVIMLERVSDINPRLRSDPFSASFKVRGNETTEVRLVPGVYKVSGTSFMNKELKIAAEKRCNRFEMNFLLTDWTKETCYDMEGTKMDQFMSGGVEFDVPATYITITPQDLYTARDITFYVLTQDILSTPEVFESIDKECGGYTCVPFAGCLFEVCDDRKINVNGRVMESIQVAAQAGNLSKQAWAYNSLTPTYN